MVSTLFRPQFNTRINPYATPSRVASLLAAAASLSLMHGCANSKQTATQPPNAIAAPEFIEVSIDGDTHEWPANVAALSDEHFVYLRFTISGEQFTLQSAPYTTAIYIDADASDLTGQRMTEPALAGLGVDLLVQFSPPQRKELVGKPGFGAALYAIDSGGNRTALSLSDYDIVFAPTYSSSWYEMRISRTPDNKSTLPTTGLLGSGSLRGVEAVLDEKGSIIASSEVFTVTTDAICQGGRKLQSLDVPAKPANAVRVVSWNVERSKPVNDPAPFARIFKAIAPDVILIQEWEEGDQVLVENWFNTHLPSSQAWRVEKSPGNMATGGGVLIASRFDLTAMPNDIITCTYRNDKGADETRPVRIVGATINSPVGSMLVGSTHLKSRGSKDSVEDRRRMAEARAINKAFSEYAAQTQPNIRVIAGDLNLVGSRPPLDLMRAALDTDGSDLSVVDASVIGDSALYTWRNDAETFTPGRLDWIVYSDASVKAANTFSLDTRRLADDALTRMGLTRTDSAASDHLPVVVDLQP